MKQPLTGAPKYAVSATLFTAQNMIRLSRDDPETGIDGISRRCIHVEMFSRVRNYFKEARMARMSDGALYLVRDLGPVKGGKGMKHHELIMPMSVRGLINVAARPARSATDWSVPASGLGAS